MKRFILLNLAVVSVVLLHAQSIDDETRNAAKLLKQNKYAEAIQELKSSIEIVEEEKLSQMKAELFPDKLLDYVKRKEKEERESMESSRSNITGNRIELIQAYTKPADSSSTNEEEYFEESLEGYSGQNTSSITLSISNAPGKMCEIANAYVNSMNEAGMREFESHTPTTFKGYRAVSSYNAQGGYGRFSVIVGGAVIEIVGDNVDDENHLIEALESIDFDDVVKLFGK